MRCQATWRQRFLIPLTALGAAAVLLGLAHSLTAALTSPAADDLTAAPTGRPHLSVLRAWKIGDLTHDLKDDWKDIKHKFHKEEKAVRDAVDGALTSPAAADLTAAPTGPPHLRVLRAWKIGDLTHDLKDDWKDIKHKFHKEEKAVRDTMDNEVQKLQQELKNQALPSAVNKWHDLKKVVEELEKFTKPVKPEGHSQSFINGAFLGMLGWLLLSGIGGFVLERSFPHFFADKEQRPPAWLFCLTLGSYVLLIPGVGCVLFSFVVGIDVLGIHVTATLDPSTNEPAPITESMISAMFALQESGNILGAVLLALYGFVIPVMKLFLLILGELLRRHRARAARLCIQLVQLSSKWACPDMFAYVLLLYLLRALPERNSFLQAPAHLDVGFTCFVVFCAASTLSSLGIPLPCDEAGPRSAAGASSGVAEGLPEAATKEAPQCLQALCSDDGPPTNGLDQNGLTQKTQEAVTVSNSHVVGLGQELPMLEPLLWRALGPAPFFLVIVALATIFAGLMFLGATRASMGLRVHVSWLVEPRGPLPKLARPLLDELHLSSVNTEVSILRLLQKLCEWAAMGELNSILGLAMLAGFALACPLLNVVLLVFAANGLRGQDVQTSRWLMQVSHVAIHLSMLGPAAVGIVVISLGGSAYRNQGVEILMEWGIVYLLAAELLHYTIYYVLETVTGALSDGPSSDAKAEDVRALEIATYETVPQVPENGAERWARPL